MQPYYHHSEAILDRYRGEMPLQHFLKQYFARHRQLGSRDRKALAEMCYCWYRVAGGLQGGEGFEMKIAAALLLCDAQVPAARKLIPAEWLEASGAHQPASEILSAAGIRFDPEGLLPAGISFSAGIGRGEWLLSILRQPRLFLRIRGKQREAEARLLDAGIPFEWTGGHCLSLPNGTKIEKLLPEESYVVQDASSQATAAFLRPEEGQSWWDLCSGAGGKSLLLADSGVTIRHSASDVRPGILHNLRERFARYRLPAPATFTADATDAAALQRQPGAARFDRILADVPCTGSGTWARTPEQLHFFRPETVPDYADRGVRIATNAAAFLKPGGRLIYLTCSAFAVENEEAVARIAAATGLKILEQQLINGLPLAADSLFGAVLG